MFPTAKMFLTHKMFLTELLFFTIKINLILVKGIDSTKQSYTPRSEQFFPFSILKKDYYRAGLEPPSYRPAQQTEVLFDTSSNDIYL